MITKFLFRNYNLNVLVIDIIFQFYLIDYYFFMKIILFKKRKGKYS